MTQLKLDPKFIFLGEFIDEGSFGRVYEGTLIIDGHPIPVAIKQMKDAEGMDKELETLRSLHHINVMKCYGLVADSRAVDSKKSHIGSCLVLELCPLGSLRNALDKLTEMKDGQTAGSGGGWDTDSAPVMISSWEVRLKVYLLRSFFVFGLS